MTRSLGTIVLLCLVTIILPSISFAQDENGDSAPDAAQSAESGVPPNDHSEEDSLWKKTKDKSGDLLKSGVEGAKRAGEKMRASSLHRSQRPYHFIGSYSGLDTWVPNKLGVSYSHSVSPRGSWEIEYQRSSLTASFLDEDFGAITDQRISIFYRSYSQRNSFSFIYGINYSDLKADLSSKYFDSWGGGNPSQYDLLVVQTLGVTWGFGNRWQLSNGFLFGVDWFKIHLPLNTLNSEADYLSANASEEDKNDIRDALDIIKKFPTFSVLKFQIGMSF